MSEELSKRLVSLCESLGVKADHLWAVLVRQAYIDGLGSLATAFGCGVLALVVLFVYFHQRNKLRGQTATAGDFKPFSSLVSGPTGFLLLVVILLTLCTVASSNLYWVITDFFNPDFYALQHLPFSR